MNSTLCEFEGDRCRVCGAPRVNVRQICGSWRAGIGDHVASGLKAIGITKKITAELLGDCGCEQRQQLLNQAGYAVGVGSPPKPAE